MSVEKNTEIPLQGLEAHLSKLGKHTQETVQDFEGLFQIVEKIDDLSEEQTQEFCNKFEDICKGNPQTAKLLGLENVA